MESNSTNIEPGNLIGMKELGILLVIIGVIGVGIAFNLDISRNGYVNLGLMDDRRNYLMGAGLAILIGAILFGLGEISRNRTVKSSSTKACPYCAEQINVDAKLCKFCHKELPQPVRQVLTSGSEAVEQLHLRGYSLEETNSGWNVWEPSGDTKKLNSEAALVEYASNRM